MSVAIQSVDVFPEGIAELPSWLVSGVLLGLAGSLAVAVVFLLADRLVPGEPRSRAEAASSESRRRAEFREHLDDIGEQYAEDHVVDGQQVAFFLPERGVAVTFDARTYYRLDRTAVDPVLVEHEVPGAMLGDRLPFETPERDTTEVVDAVRAAFAELGVPVGASLEEVRRAYRRRVKEVHPDQGGDEAAFRRVREAYTLAREHAR